MNEIGIYLSFDRKMIFVSESYRVQDFFDEFLEYEVRYVFNVTVMCFLDLNKTFKENHIAHCDMLIYGSKFIYENFSGLFRSISSKCLCEKQSG